ncbi:hypothetical protein AAFF_G00242200 [Aldrovandia affinis]|uniref:Uncharacterized protein n=1 Tax=Aldrovandia affinis TaxID=143900 RepID=A0AAD7WUX5_9TELE|nr:hypothetical protein AAFF_G00242200 [Aldrovandia affinis]
MLRKKTKQDRWQTDPLFLMSRTLFLSCHHPTPMFLGSHQAFVGSSIMLEGAMDKNSSEFARMGDGTHQRRTCGIGPLVVQWYLMHWAQSTLHLL